MFRSEKGFTLVEAVVAIVILSVGIAAFLQMSMTTMRYSADPMLSEQANAIAQSYMEEVLLKPFCDPNDFSTDCPTDCILSACGNCSGSTSDGVTTEIRSTYDDICDYDGLSNNAGAVDQSGVPVPGLSDYRVNVSIDDSASLNGLSGASGQTLKVTVSVSHASNTEINVEMNAFRANY